MKEIMSMIAFFIIFIILVSILTLIIWGIEAFLIVFFTINNKWNFLRVLGVLYILMVLKYIFSSSNKNENN